MIRLFLFPPYKNPSNLLPSGNLTPVAVQVRTRGRNTRSCTAFELRVSPPVEKKFSHSHQSSGVLDHSGSESVFKLTSKFQSLVSAQWEKAQ